MSYEDRIVFPDEVENMKAAATGNAGAGKTMLDDDRIVFPDEAEHIKAAAAGGTGVKETTADFDYDRVVFPDEVEEVKAKAAAGAGDNFVEAPEIDPRNKLQGAGECECVNAQFDLRFQYHHNGSKPSKAQCTGGCVSVEAPKFDLRYHYGHKRSKPRAGCCSFVEEPQFDLGPISPR